MNDLRIKCVDGSQSQEDCDVRPIVCGGVWDEFPNLKALFDELQSLISGSQKEPSSNCFDKGVKKPNSVE